MVAKSLANRHFLITRPHHQAQPLSHLIAAHGGSATVLPTIAIKPPRDPASLQRALSKLATYDIAIVVSANAVPPLVTYARHLTTLHVIAIGPGTAAALVKNAITVDFIPTIYSTIGLLKLPILTDVQDKTIIILCGEDSAASLADNLTLRGACVDLAVCYRRVCPQIDTAQIAQLRLQSIDAIVSTSQESLRNLSHLFPHSTAAWLYHHHLVVISSTMVKLARGLGFIGDISTASNASDQAIVATLKEIS